MTLEAGVGNTPVDPLEDLKLVKTGITPIWFLISGFVILSFLTPGFALREAGSTAGTKVLRALGRDFALCTLGTVGLWICGFGLMFGGSGLGSMMEGPSALDKMVSLTIGGKTFDVLGRAGFFPTGAIGDAMIVSLLSFQTAFLIVAILIPTGAMAGRWRFLSVCVYGLVFSTLLYPMYGAWVWGGGWLGDLGVNFGLGNGFIDFAGSSVVHMSGGMVGLAGAWILGPRVGRFSGDGPPNETPGFSVKMVLLGTLTLALAPLGFNPGSIVFVTLGSIGFKPGSTLVAGDLRLMSIATCATLAMVAGCITSILWTWVVRAKPRVINACNGLLAGVVASAGACAFVNPIGALIIGALAGVLLNVSVLLVERVLKIDDPVGAISVHGICGGFGCLCVALLADGAYGAGWNGVAAAPRGLLYGGGLGQLAAQVIGVVANFALVFPSAVAYFWVVGKTIGNRIMAKPEH